MKPVPFSGSLTEAQFFRMQELASPFNFRRIGYAILVLFAFALAAGGYRSVLTEPLQHLAPLIFFPTVALTFIIGIPWAIRRQWRRSPILGATITGEIDEAGVQWNSPFVAARYPWEQIQKAINADDMVVLYIAAFSVLYFPRQFFGDEASWQAFQGTVASRVSARK